MSGTHAGKTNNGGGDPCHCQWRGVFIPVVEPTAHARFEMRRRERKLKSLNQMVFCVALSEWAGNAIGTLAMLWATVVSSCLRHSALC